MAVWSLDCVVEMTAPCPLIDILVHERTLSRGLPHTCPPPEQFFNPTTYNFGKMSIHFFKVIIYGMNIGFIVNAVCNDAELFSFLDGSCLLNAGIVHFTCSGHQKEVSFCPSLNIVCHVFKLVY